jgi:predicted transcriptional regulator
VKTHLLVGCLFAFDQPARLKCRMICEREMCYIVLSDKHIRVSNMPDATFTFRVEDELKAAFTAAAKAHDRTGAQLLRDFMRDYVGRQRDEQGYDPWFRRQVQAGIEDAAAGRVVSADEVNATFAARRAETLRRLDGAKS